MTTPLAYMGCCRFTATTRGIEFLYECHKRKYLKTLCGGSNFKPMLRCLAMTPVPTRTYWLKKTKAAVMVSDTDRWLEIGLLKQLPCATDDHTTGIYGLLPFYSYYQRHWVSLWMPQEKIPQNALWRSMKMPVRCVREDKPHPYSQPVPYCSAAEMLQCHTWCCSCSHRARHQATCRWKITSAWISPGLSNIHFFSAYCPYQYSPWPCSLKWQYCVSYNLSRHEVWGGT